MSRNIAFHFRSPIGAGAMPMPPRELSTYVETGIVKWGKIDQGYPRQSGLTGVRSSAIISL
jgi:hypothetical protein